MRERREGRESVGLPRSLEERVGAAFGALGGFGSLGGRGGRTEGWGSEGEAIGGGGVDMARG